MAGSKVLLLLRTGGEMGMSQQYFIFFGLVGAFIIALCISIFVIINRIYYEVYELKKDFRRWENDGILH